MSHSHEMKPKLIFVSAKTCPACVTFKRNSKPELKTQLNQRNLVDWIEIEYETLQDIADNIEIKGVHPDLNKFSRMFVPCLILVPGEQWDDPDSILDGIVYGATKNSDGLYYPSNNIDLRSSAILKWIRETLSNNAIFNTPNVSKKRIDRPKPKKPVCSQYSGINDVHFWDT